MYQFNYVKAKSLQEAVKLLAGNAEAKLLAGGMTLMPTLKQRLAQSHAPGRHRGPARAAQASM